MTELTSDPIIPDDKDWTWVLEQRCPECGYEMSGIDRDNLAPRLRQVAQEWVLILDDEADALRRRPHPGQWSKLEYGAHVRDVFVRFGERIDLMLRHDDPLFPNWDQDETARTDRYNEQDPWLVAKDLSAAGEAVASTFSSIAGSTWDRPGRRSDGSTFTVESLGRYLLHDPLHHVWDVS